MVNVGKYTSPMDASWVMNHHFLPQGIRRLAPRQGMILLSMMTWTVPATGPMEMPGFPWTRARNKNDVWQDWKRVDFRFEIMVTSTSKNMLVNGSWLYVYWSFFPTKNEAQIESNKEPEMVGSRFSISLCFFFLWNNRDDRLGGFGYWNWIGPNFESQGNDMEKTVVWQNDPVSTHNW